MGLFSRRGATAPDDALPVLSRGQADRLRAAVLAALADPRHPAPVDGGSVVLSVHGVLPLAELAGRAAAVPDHLWDDLVRRYLASVLAPPTVATDLDAVRDVLLPRLLPATADVLSGGPAGRPADGLAVRFALDLPDRVELLADLEPLGGLAAVAPVAETNLRRLPAPDHHLLREHDGSVLHVFDSGDFHGATRLLAVEDVLVAAGVPVPAAGMLVAVPHRHLLLVHPVTGPDVVPAMSRMLRLAGEHHEGADGAIRPDVYFRDAGGALQRVTSRSADGRDHVHVHGAFADAVSGLGVA